MGLDQDSDIARRFQEVISARRGSLLQAAFMILKDSHEAEDVVQETLSEVWKRITAIPDEKLEGYLFQAVQFNALKRRTRRKSFHPLEKVAEPVAREAEKEKPEMEEIDPFRLERILADLPETQQVVVRMKYYLNFTFREIGKALSISSNTAASRCRYAIEQLRKKLKSKRKEV